MSHTHGAAVVAALALSECAAHGGHPGSFGHGGGAAIGGLAAIVDLVELGANVAVIAERAAQEQAQDGQCGDTADCGTGQACVGPEGASRGHCVEEQAIYRPGPAPAAKSTMVCDPTADPRWHGAPFEEKERLYNACARPPAGD